MLKGLVCSSRLKKRPVEDAVDVFDEMEAGTIQGRMVLDFHSLMPLFLLNKKTDYSMVSSFFY